MKLKSKVFLAACALWFLGMNPARAAILYVSLHGGPSNGLARVDTTTGVITPLTPPTIHFADSLALFANNKKIVYDVNDTGISELHVCDLSTIPCTDTLLVDFSALFPGNPQGSDPQDLVVEPGGASVLVSHEAGNYVTRTILSTGVTTKFIPNINAPEGIAYDKTGRLFILAGFQQPNAGIFQYDSNGNLVASNSGFDPTNTLDGLTFDPTTGFLYATSAHSGALFRINPNNLTDVHQVATLPVVNLTGPDGLAVDNKGLLYIAERGTAPESVYTFDAKHCLATGVTPCPADLLKLVDVPNIDDPAPIPPDPPTVLKLFTAVSPPGIFVGGSTTMTLSITNPNVSSQLVGVDLTDNIPAGLVATAPLGATAACGGTFTVTASKVTLVGATLAANGTCNLPTITVRGIAPSLPPFTAPGYHNCATVTSLEGGDGLLPSCADLIVAPILSPTLAKSFDSPAILVGGSTTLRLVLSNTTAGASLLTGVGFTDSLPAQIQATAPLGSTAACGGTFTVTATTLTLSGATFAPNATCTLPAVTVKGVQPGQANNVTSTVISNEAPPGAAATATTTVARPPAPVIAKTFDNATLLVGGSTTLRLVLSNTQPGSGTLTGVGFTDPLPAQIQATAPLGPTAACGGTFTVTATTLTLSGASLAPNATCTLPAVTVKAVQPGQANNVTSTVTSNEALPGSPASATTTITRPPAPILTKTFDDATVQKNTSTTLRLVLANTQPGAGTLTGVGFTDPLPPQIQATAPLGATPACGGTFTVTATTLTLSGATFAPNATCTLPAVTVKGVTAGQALNTTSTVTSNEALPGPVASATTTVFDAPPPILLKGFDDPTIQLNLSTTLRLRLSSATGSLTGVGFTDPLPPQIQATAPLGATPACGGTFTVTATTLTLSGAILAPNTTCILPPVTVKGVQPGLANNVTSTVTSNEAVPGLAATATIIVTRPPAPILTKAFDSATVQLGASTTLRLVLANTQPSAGVLTSVGFTDPLPAQIQATAPLGATPACGGTFTVTATTLTLSGATLAVNATCTLPPVTVKGVQPGQADNVTSTVSSTEALPGSAASATTTVIRPPAPILTKAFDNATIQLNASTTLRLVLANTQALAGVLTSVGFTDPLPAQLQATAPLGATPACGGTFTVTATTLTLTGATLAINATCTLPPVTVKGVQPGLANNVTSTVSSTEALPGSPASATTTVIRPPAPILTKTFDNATVQLGTFTTLRLVLANTQPSAGALTGVGFTDSLPPQIQATAPLGATPACGGTFTVTATTLILSGANLAANGTCTLPPVTVQGVQPGQANNVTSTVSSTEALPGPPASASTTVFAPLPPVILKSFAASVIQIGGTTTLSFTITNPNTNPTFPLNGITFTDTLPTDIQATGPLGAVPACNGGTFTVTATTITLTGGTLAGGASCTLPNVTVIGLTNSSDLNCVTVSANQGIGNQSCASITVGNPPGVFQVRYASHLDIGDSVVNLTNTGRLTLPSDPATTGNMCVNVYTFDASEELISCCSCLVTPNGLNSLSARNDLISNTLTAGVPTSIVIKLLSTTPLGLAPNGSGGTCNPSSPIQTPAGPGIGGSLAPGMLAWGTTIHALPTTPVTYGVAETPFEASDLSPAEMTKLTTFCGFIQTNGSGFGICKSCRTGGLGGAAK
jgi:hypothetical protein